MLELHYQAEGFPRVFGIMVANFVFLDIEFFLGCHILRWCSHWGLFARFGCFIGINLPTAGLVPNRFWGRTANRAAAMYVLACGHVCYMYLSNYLPIQLTAATLLST